MSLHPECCSCTQLRLDRIQLSREVETLRRWNGQLKALLCIVTPLMVFFFLAAVGFPAWMAK